MSDTDLQLSRSRETALSLVDGKSKLVTRGREDLAVILAEVPSLDPPDPLYELYRLAVAGDADAQTKLGDAYYSRFRHKKFVARDSSASKDFSMAKVWWLEGGRTRQR